MEEGREGEGGMEGDEGEGRRRGEVEVEGDKMNCSKNQKSQLLLQFSVFQYFYFLIFLYFQFPNFSFSTI